MSSAELQELLRQRDVQIQEMSEQIKNLQKEIRSLKKLLVEKASSKESQPPKESSNYSVARHEQKQRKRQPKHSTGRKPQSAKREQVAETIDLYWHNARRKQCVLHRQQCVWRLIDGKASYVCYRIFDAPDSHELPSIDGVRNSRCEYGIEILVSLAYLVYWTGLSIDKSRAILTFFTKLPLSKSQADSLLSQLSADWQTEYDAIAGLIASSSILYIDETGWKVGKRSCYTWIFSTLSAVLFKCGVGRGKVVLTEVLGDQFAGIGVTDDYNVYSKQFTQHQLCWAHFLRKAIAISLRNPENQQYQRFLKSLFAIYYDAVRSSRDGRLSTGRKKRVGKLQSRIRMVCRRSGEASSGSTDDAKFVRLQNELVRNTEKLFVFVLHPEVEATNNRSEREARGEAMARKATRTSKTQSGAKRRAVLMSVLASLSKRYPRFTLDIVLSEVHSWLDAGESLFQKELVRLREKPAALI